MLNSKLIVAYGSLSEPDFQIRVSPVLAGLTDHPKFPLPWPDPVPSLAQLKAEDAAYREAQLAVQSRDLRQIHKRDEARERLTLSLKRVAAYVELIADGDISALQSTGFELRRDGGRPVGVGTPGTVYLAAPADFRVGKGPRSGSIKVDATSQRGSMAYEIQITRGDPNVEEGWKQAAIVGSIRHVVVDNLEPGPTWVRLRAVRRNGVSTPWTSPISVIIG
ncbi:MAG: fibronectin type III domain-containing protein [Burkholderiales bacterium]|nr:fibronectin type III domain-containing protein [Burkholderiales bacterium]